MKVRILRKDHIVLSIAAGIFGLALIAINAEWPSAFGVFIAIGGSFGALMVLYEIRMTKRIAQAEFIRDLQTSFSTDNNIGELWRKLLLKEEITAADRPLVSSYLTFFETLHLLLEKGALDLDLTDDLFRNRFFTAVGDKGVLDTALISQAGAFANIHDLIATWHDHLVLVGTPIHPGYYRYIRALTEAKGYEIVRLDGSDLPDLMALQERVIDSLEDASWLRANSEEMLAESLKAHITFGARREGQLAAAAVLYDGKRTEESIREYFTKDVAQLDRSINLKLVLTDPEHRGQGLARTLVEILEPEAAALDKAEMLSTIHPKNRPSQALFELLGYERIGKVDTAYGKRLVYGRVLPRWKKRWAR